MSRKYVLDFANGREFEPCDDRTASYFERLGGGE